MLVNVLTTWMMMMELFNLQNMEDLLGFLGLKFGWNERRMKMVFLRIERKLREKMS
jgi:hypothetical protein